MLFQAISTWVMGAGVWPVKSLRPSFMETPSQSVGESDGYLLHGKAYCVWVGVSDGLALWGWWGSV